MLGKIRRYFKGRVYLTLKGEGLARFINQALKDGVVFYNGRKLKDCFVAEINARDFRRLRQAVKETDITLHIRAKYGFPFVAWRWQRRKGLLAGLVIIFIALVVLSQFVISIDVEGNERVPTSQILAEAEKLGLKKWVLKRNLQFDTLGKEIQERMSDLIWAAVDERGTNIRIRVVEKTLPQEVLYKGDLFASKRGYVDTVIVIQGQALVEEGQIVEKGQKLIKAEGGMTEFSIGSEGQVKERQVEAPAAKGFVRGRVWYSSEKKVPHQEEVVEKTGKKAKGWGIKIRDRVIMITNRNSPFEISKTKNRSYTFPNWRNWSFPVEIIINEYEEMHKVRVTRTVKEARELAEKLAREELKKEIPAEALVLNDRVRLLSTEKGVEHIRVEIETFEELAVYRQ